MARGARRLESHRHARIGKDWRAWLAASGIPKTNAYRWLELARLPVSQIGTFTTEQAAIEAVREAEKPQPAPVVQAEPGDPPAVDPEVLPAEPEPEPEDDPAAVAESVAREAEPDPAAVREDRLERLAIRLQDEDGEAVDVLHRKLEASEGRERGAMKRALKAERERDGMKRALLKGGRRTRGRGGCARGARHRAEGGDGMIAVRDLASELKLTTVSVRYHCRTRDIECVRRLPEGARGGQMLMFVADADAARIREHYSARLASLDG